MVFGLPCKHNILVCIQSGIMSGLQVLKQNNGAHTVLADGALTSIASSQLRLVMHLTSFSLNTLVTSKVTTDFNGSNRLTGTDIKLYTAERKNTISVPVAQKLTFHQLGPIPMQAFTTSPM